MLNRMSVFSLFLFLKRMNGTADNTHILYSEWGYSACIAPDAWLGIHAESFVHTTWHGVIIYLCLCRCSCRTVAYISYVNGMHACVCATACLLLVGTNLGNPPQLLSRVLPLSPCFIDLGVCMCYFATTIAILDSDLSGHVSAVCVCLMNHSVRASTQQASIHIQTYMHIYCLLLLSHMSAQHSVMPIIYRITMALNGFQCIRMCVCVRAMPVYSSYVNVKVFGLFIRRSTNRPTNRQADRLTHTHTLKHPYL